MGLGLEQDHPLSRLGTSGLRRVLSSSLQENDPANSLLIKFITPRRERTARYLSRQIEQFACQYCPLRTTTANIKCSGVETDNLNQISAVLESKNWLSKESWQELIRDLRPECQPTLVK